MNGCAYQFFYTADVGHRFCRELFFSGGTRSRFIPAFDLFVDRVALL